MEQKLRSAAAALPETALNFDEIRTASRLQEHKPHWGIIIRRAAAVAVCLVALLGVGFGGYAYASEAKEYKEAVAFFDENDLSTDGLSRAEIKAVYRDITTRSFTYSKTVWVIQESLIREKIEGFEILQGDPTPEDVENLWNYRISAGPFVPWEQPKYDFGVESVEDNRGNLQSKYYLEKYDGDTALWRVYLPFWQGEYQETTDGVVAFGDNNYAESGAVKKASWVAKIDHDGNLLWIIQINNGFDKEYASRLLIDQDGSYTLFSNGDGRYLCVSRYTPDGERILFTKTDMGHLSIGHATHYGDGYLLQVSEGKDWSKQFIRLDRNGNVIDGFSYGDKENYYVIQDMLAFGEKVYISAYALPKDYVHISYLESIDLYMFDELGPIRAHYGLLSKIPSEEVTATIRNIYSAVLLVCDPADNGSIQTFYSIPGSLGAELAIDDSGQLVWETESITSMVYSPMTSAYTYAGNCYVYQSFFDTSGKLVGMGKTDRVTNFYR